MTTNDTGTTTTQRRSLTERVELLEQRAGAVPYDDELTLKCARAALWRASDTTLLAVRSALTGVAVRDLPDLTRRDLLVHFERGDLARPSLVLAAVEEVAVRQLLDSAELLTSAYNIPAPFASLARVGERYLEQRLEDVDEWPGTWPIRLFGHISGALLEAGIVETYGVVDLELVKRAVELMQRGELEELKAFSSRHQHDPFCAGVYCGFEQAEGAGDVDQAEPLEGAGDVDQAVPSPSASAAVFAELTQGQFDTLLLDYANLKERQYEDTARIVEAQKRALSLYGFALKLVRDGVPDDAADQLARIEATCCVCDGTPIQPLKDGGHRRCRACLCESGNMLMYYANKTDLGHFKEQLWQSERTVVDQAARNWRARNWEALEGEVLEGGRRLIGAARRRSQSLVARLVGDPRLTRGERELLADHYQTTSILRRRRRKGDTPLAIDESRS